MMHTRVGQWLDTVGSGRFEPQDIDGALNTAISNKVDELFHPMDPKQLENAFQTHQRIKDSLYTLITPSALINASNGIIPLTTLTDYRYCVDLYVTINGKEYVTKPLNYEDYESVTTLDPHARPTLTYPPNVYRLETAEGFIVKFGPVGTLTKGRVVYIKNPVLVTIGTGGSDAINTDLPINLHEELCRMAAEYLAAQTLHLINSNAKDSSSEINNN